MARQKNQGYNGNSKIKKAGTRHVMSADKIEEIKKCRDDPIYFIRNYVKIRTEKGSELFNMWDFQENIVRLINEERYSIITCSRQIGKTTIVMSYIAWYSIFHAKKNVAILANKGKTAYGIMRKFKEIYEHIPLWMQQGVEEWNKSTVEFENGTIIYTTATSPDAVRGDTIDLCMIDEAAFIGDELWDEFWEATWPTISSRTQSKMVLISTPKGMNHFYDIHKEAHENLGSGDSGNFVPYDVKWDEHPDRDEKWKADQLKNMSYNKFLQEFELQFLGSDGTLIDISTLTKIKVQEPVQILWDDAFQIFEKPHASKRYAAVVDTSHGVGLDFSVITVFDMTYEDKFKQVAMFRSNKISHTILAEIVHRVCMIYNNPVLVIENNDMGAIVAHAMNDDYEYENLYATDTFDEQGGKLNVGVRTTTATKSMGCNNLKSLIEMEKLEIVEGETVRELSNFSRHKRSYKAASGNDDIVMTLVIFAWAVRQQNFIEMSGMDLIGEIDSEQLNRMDEDMSDEVSVFGPSDFDFVSPDQGLGL